MISPWTILVVAGFIALYITPILVGNGKKHLAGITILTIALGWTFLGWIGALIWAVSSPKK